LFTIRVSYKLKVYSFKDLTLNVSLLQAYPVCLVAFIIILVIIIITTTTTTPAASARRHHVNSDYRNEIVDTWPEECVRVCVRVRMVEGVIRLFAPASLVVHIASPE
jgi:hypothetical protein